MVYLNSLNVLDMLVEVYQATQCVRTPRTEAEMELKDYIFYIMESYKTNGHMYVDIEEDLSWSNKSDIASIPSEDEMDEWDAPTTCNVQTTRVNSSDTVDVEYKRRAVSFWKRGKRKMSWKSVQKWFKRVRCRTNLYRWEKQITEGETKREKLAAIDRTVYEQFTTAKQPHLIVHDTDL